MEVVRFHSRGGFSVRSIFVFALTVIITAILWATFSINDTHAQTPTGAWTDGGAILYDGHGYNAATDLTDSTGTIPSDAKVYKTATQPGTGTAGSKVFIIYFSSGVDPPKATSARYVEFSLNGTTLSNPQNGRDITMAPQGTQSGHDTACAVGGIGWIICPVSVFLAESMDNLFNILADLIKTQPPIIGDPNNGMFVAWGIARTIANLAFVIAFLIIIFSQLTNVGVSNYGLKKLIPRLVIAAVLVNISFYIAALAIDISNILGYSVQNIFNNIREQVFHLDGDNFSGVNNNAWTTVTTVVLAGGGTIGGIIYLSSVGPFFLVTLLVGLALTALFVILILAARQAIITLLVIVSPLAFVAYLLPNTEKWFEKWKDLFMTMLIFFPAFALVFGGAQLAGQLIIQNAGDNIVTVIFGMAVQVAPLIITPILLKFSGGLLGKIAQIANDPRKGVMDRARNWRKEEEDLWHRKALQKDTTGLKRFRPAAAVKAIDRNKRKRHELTEMYKLRGDNEWEQSKGYQKIHDRMNDAERDKKLIHAQLEKHAQSRVLGNSKLLEQEMKIRITEEGGTDIKGRIDATYFEMKSGTSTASNRYGAQFIPLEQQAAETSRNVALNAMRQQSAKRAESQKLYQDLKDNSASFDGQLLRSYAGGAQGHTGAQRALAQAISEQHKAHAEVVANANAILDDYNLDAAENLSIAKSISVKNVDITADIQEAAIKRVASNGVIPHIEELLKSVDFSPNGNEDFRLALVESLKGNGSRPKFIGFGTMDKITQGIAGGINDNVIDDWIEAMLIDGKLSAKELAAQDKDTLIRIQQAIPRLNTKTGRSPQEQVSYFKAMDNLRSEVTAVRNDSELWNAAGERKRVIDDIENAI